MPQTRKTEKPVEEIEQPEQAEATPADTPSTSEPNGDKQEDDAAAKARERQQRFKALRQRARSANERNLKETAAETQRLATDPNLAKSLDRKHDFAAHKLLKADTEAGGEDFERKRAWDWTVEESEKWDRRLEKKQRHRDDVAFQDYTQDARKVYGRQMRQLAPNLEAYEKEKLAAIEKAAANGDLEIVETEDGEMIAIDKNGSFYSTADSVGFTDNKPDRAAVDRLVGDLQKAEDERLRKRKARRGDEEADVTYINDKNKHFNQKLARFYNKYTTEIRESFERGTMI
ncbi:Pre-mRNA-splicing factor syf2 [Penicillium herquei]|nr:Pre-mRNA-splicing factor syf2 [Penicillium herquei]